jgi:hypothetical protein
MGDDIACGRSKTCGRRLWAGLAIRYERVYGAKCSLAGADGAACWRGIRHETGPEGIAPDCNADFAREQKRTHGAAALDDPTAMEYDVATTLTAKGAHIAAIGGMRPRCRPEDWSFAPECWHVI